VNQLAARLPEGEQARETKEELARLNAEMDERRRSIGLYCMLYLRSIAPHALKSPGGALSGGMTEKHGIIHGNVGAGGVQVKLRQMSQSSCDLQGTVLQTTDSQQDGAYAFSQQVSQSASYCIEYGTQTHVCNCAWANDECSCSPQATPRP